MTKPIPKPNPETKPFWDGCAAGELRLQRCNACGHVQFYPRKLCSACFSPDVSWFTASGRGEVISWSLVALPSAPGFEDELPFTSILVKLDEGPTMLSVLRECEYESISQGMPISVIFEKRTEEISVPYFKPAE